LYSPKERKVEEKKETRWVRTIVALDTFSHCMRVITVGETEPLEEPDGLGVALVDTLGEVVGVTLVVAETVTVGVTVVEPETDPVTDTVGLPLDEPLGETDVVAVTEVLTY